MITSPGPQPFLEALSENREVLRTQPSCPDELSLQYDDKHGLTELTLRNMQVNIEGETTFTLDYAHTSSKGSSTPAATLSRLLPPGGYFTAEDDDRGFVTRLAYEADQQVAVNLDLEELAKNRGRLWLVAHEISHAPQGTMANFLCARIVEGSEGSAAVQSRFAPYQPALEHIIDAKDITGYRDIVETWERKGISEPGRIQEGRIQALSLADGVSAGVNAVLEADAWVNAFHLVNRGELHPGLSEDELKDEAFACIKTYDGFYGTPNSQLFSRTLSHALHFVNL